MERIAAAHADSPFEFAFAPVTTAAQRLVQLDQVTLGYAAGRRCSRARLGNLERRPHRSPRPEWRRQIDAAEGDRRRVDAAEGRAARRARRSRSATSRNTRSSRLRLDETALWHLAKMEPTAREQDLRDFLGGFDFRGEMATHPVARLSGGEKARLTLALLVRQKPNLLLLDEPTNHLDIEMREALAEALQDYGGALVVVAHDRICLRATTDALWLVADGRVAPFDGDLDDYRDWVLERSRRSGDGER
jgi:ATP-binding cassette subfamily F protein 3